MDFGAFTMTQRQGGFRTAAEASLLGESIRDRMTPVVMVLAAPGAEEVCQRNGLSMTDLLRPHCEFRNINVPVRTSGEVSYRLLDWKVRVMSAAEVKAADTEAAEKHLLDFFSNCSSAAAAEYPGDSKDVMGLRDMFASDRYNAASWFARFTSELHRTLLFSPHEAVDHPVACLLVIDSSVSDPVSLFNDLFAPENLPSIFRSAAADPAILKHYILLHDMQQRPANQIDETLSRLRLAFGPQNLKLLVVNSAEEADVKRRDLWSDFMPQAWGEAEGGRSSGGEGAAAAAGGEGGMLPSDSPLSAPDASQAPPPPPSPPSPPPRGQFLTDSDVQEVSDFMTDFVVKQLIPHLEHKVRELNQQVSASRKGLRNQIKSLWFGRSKEESSDTTPGVYTFRSSESQIRLLADMAMMLRDYQLASDNYRLLANDYRKDKAWKHYAGAQEMLGLTLFLLESSRREMEQSLEAAYSSYQRCGSPSSRFAIRAILWLAEILKTRGSFREAALTLMRASLEETGLKSGLLLEQSAISFLRAEPPMVRKYGFHMVLAGNRYNLSGQRQHAVRAYRYVLGVYGPKIWTFISDHCNFTLGRLSAFLGDYDAAIGFFVQLLLCQHQSAAMQATFLREFLYVMQAVESSDQKGPLELPLPVVDHRSIAVHFADHRTYASAAAEAISESVWSSLEEGVVPPAAALVVPTWLDRPLSKEGGEGRGGHEAVATNNCCAGEDITVEVQLSNPLHIPLQLSELRLVCHHSHASPVPAAPSAAGTTSASVHGATAVQLSQPAPELHRAASTPSLVEASHQEGDGERGGGEEGGLLPIRASSFKSQASEAAVGGEGLEIKSPTPSWQSRTKSQSDLATCNEALLRLDEGDDDNSKVTSEDLAVGKDKSGTVPEKPEAQAAASGQRGVDVSSSAVESRSEDFEVEAMDVTLNPGETSVVRLKVVPLKEGILHIKALQWVLTSEGRKVSGFAALEPKGAAKRKGKKAGQLPPKQRLHFHVMPEMSRLHVHLHGLPAKMNAGEVLRLVLELTNTSPSIALHHLKMRSSHPELLLLGSLSDLDRDLLHCLEAPRQQQAQRRQPDVTTEAGATTGAAAAEAVAAGTFAPNAAAAAGDYGTGSGGGKGGGGGGGEKDEAKEHLVGSGGVAFCFPEFLCLEAGSTLLWPLWLRCPSEGEVSLNSIFCYQSIRPSLLSPSSSASSPAAAAAHSAAAHAGFGLRAAIKTRTLRATHTLQVHQSLAISSRLSPSPTSLHRQVLRLDVENKHPSDSFWLRQVSCSRGSWALKPMHPTVISSANEAFLEASVAAPQLLPPGQGTCLFFHLQAVDAEGSEKPPSSRGREFVTTVSLGGVGEATVDVSRGPLKKLLDREKGGAWTAAKEKNLEVQTGSMLAAPGWSEGHPISLTLLWGIQAAIPSSSSFSDMQATSSPNRSSSRIGIHQITDASLLPLAASRAASSPAKSATSASSATSAAMSAQDALAVASRRIREPAVRWRLEGPTRVEHDFIHNHVCFLKFSLFVRNCSPRLVAILVKTVNPLQAMTSGRLSGQGSSHSSPTVAKLDQAGWFCNLPASSALASAQAISSKGGAVDAGEEVACGVPPMGPYTWTSTTGFEFEEVRPGEERVVSLTAMVFAPGVYNFSSYEVSWREKGQLWGNKVDSSGTLTRLDANTDVAKKAAELGKGAIKSRGKKRVAASGAGGNHRESVQGSGFGSQYLVVVSEP